MALDFMQAKPLLQLVNKLHWLFYLVALDPTLRRCSELFMSIAGLSSAKIGTIAYACIQVFNLETSKKIYIYKKKKKKSFCLRT